MISSDKSRKVAIALAFLGAFQPTPIPLTFLHKLYLGQYGWGAVYFLLGFTQIARIACAVEGVWYLLAHPEALGWQLTLSEPDISEKPLPSQRTAAQMSAAAQALRELEQLRQEGLLSEYEFEQKRRHLLDLDR
ncbi:MAG: hypothetical protein F6J97_06530 [Leptolyngbya sp. SIO4C1]|nr:hypothetical protein [Leptolyngbya sp. SIO4C1]